MGGGEFSEGEQERTDDSETRDLECSEERQEGAADNLENQESLSRGKEPNTDSDKGKEGEKEDLSVSSGSDFDVDVDEDEEGMSLDEFLESVDEFLEPFMRATEDSFSGQEPPSDWFPFAQSAIAVIGMFWDWYFERGPEIRVFTFPSIQVEEMKAHPYVVRAQAEDYPGWRECGPDVRIYGPRHESFQTMDPIEAGLKPTLQFTGGVTIFILEDPKEAFFIVRNRTSWNSFQRHWSLILGSYAPDSTRESWSRGTEGNCGDMYQYYVWREPRHRSSSPDVGGERVDPDIDEEPPVDEGHNLDGDADSSDDLEPEEGEVEQYECEPDLAGSDVDIDEECLMPEDDFEGIGDDGGEPGEMPQSNPYLDAIGNLHLPPAEEWPSPDVGGERVDPDIDEEPPVDEGHNLDGDADSSDDLEPEEGEVEQYECEPDLAGSDVDIDEECLMPEDDFEGIGDDGGEPGEMPQSNPYLDAIGNLHLPPAEEWPSPDVGGERVDPDIDEEPPVDEGHNLGGDADSSDDLEPEEGEVEQYECEPDLAGSDVDIDEECLMPEDDFEGIGDDGGEPGEMPQSNPYLDAIGNLHLPPAEEWPSPDVGGERVDPDIDEEPPVDEGHNLGGDADSSDDLEPEEGEVEQYECEPDLAGSDVDIDEECLMPEDDFEGIGECLMPEDDFEGIGDDGGEPGEMPQSNSYLDAIGNLHLPPAVEALLDRLGSPGAQASVREQLGSEEWPSPDVGGERVDPDIDEEHPVDEGHNLGGDADSSDDLEPEEGEVEQYECELDLAGSDVDIDEECLMPEDDFEGIGDDGGEPGEMSQSNPYLDAIDGLEGDDMEYEGDDTCEWGDTDGDFEGIDTEGEGDDSCDEPEHADSDTDTDTDTVR